MKRLRPVRIALMMTLAGTVMAWSFIPKVRAWGYLATFMAGPESVRVWALDRSATLGEEAVPIVTLVLREEAYYETFLRSTLYKHPERWKSCGFSVVGLDCEGYPSPWFVLSGPTGSSHRASIGIYSDGAVFRGTHTKPFIK